MYGIFLMDGGFIMNGNRMWRIEWHKFAFKLDFSMILCCCEVRDSSVLLKLVAKTCCRGDEEEFRGLIGKVRHSLGPLVVIFC